MAAPTIHVNCNPQSHFRKSGPILRVRTGCLTCRSRKKKCDEAKPVCSGCRRNKLDCTWPKSPKSRPSKTFEQPARHQLNELSSHSVSCENNDPASGTGGHDPAHAGAQVQTAGSSTTSDSETWGSPPSIFVGVDGQHGQEQGMDYIENGFSMEPFAVPNLAMPDSHHVQHHPPSQPTLPRPPGTDQPHSPLDAAFFGFANDVIMDSNPQNPVLETNNHPDIDHDDNGEDVAELDKGLAEDLEEDVVDMDPEVTSLQLQRPRRPSFAVPAVAPSMYGGVNSRSLQLLSYYLSRTAQSMGNGSTDSNPFIVELVPLTHANDLVLQLVLAQSALHQEASGMDVHMPPQREYAIALRHFQTAIDDYVGGNETNPLWVTIGALIMCFTETARGDVNGVVFDHLGATGPLLSKLMVQSRSSLSESFKDFITEYYVYTALISMISMGPTATVVDFLRPDLEQRAHVMAESGYIGQLCGCWLPLLLIIRSIFEFGGRIMASATSPTMPFPIADDFITFSSIQRRITSFIPNPKSGFDVATCGYIYQQAIHLYLLTSLEAPSQGTVAGPFQHTINSCLDHAFDLLDQVLPTNRINTSLCWALAVIGSCVKDNPRREKLRQRIHTMFNTIGLGNIRGTLTLLELVWELPPEQQSPWCLHKVMQENQMWISFA